MLQCRAHWKCEETGPQLRSKTNNTKERQRCKANLIYDIPETQRDTGYCTVGQRRHLWSRACDCSCMHRNGGEQWQERQISSTANVILQFCFWGFAMGGRNIKEVVKATQEEALYCLGTSQLNWGMSLIFFPWVSCAELRNRISATVEKKRQKKENRAQYYMTTWYFSQNNVIIFMK